MPRLSPRYMRIIRLLFGYVIFVILLENLILMFHFGNPGRHDGLPRGPANNSSRNSELRTIVYVNTVDVGNMTSLYEADDHLPLGDALSGRHNRSQSSSVTFPPPVKAAPLTATERAFYRRQDTKVNPYTHGFVLPGDQICDEQTDMVIIVHSSAPFTDRRRAIRRTWGSVVNGGEWPHNRTIGLNLKLAFIFGLHKDPAWNAHLRRENEELGDVIQGDFLDTYKNMTLKSLLGLKWVVNHCPSATYLLKSDDDMFINIPYLIETLHYRNMRRTIMGPLCLGSPVYRKGKWGIKKDDFPFSRYPPYEAGSAYVITGDIIAELFETSEYVPAIFIDDVYITGILGRIIGVDHAQQRGFAYWPTKAPVPCHIIYDDVITGHKMKGPILLDFWKRLKTTNPKTCKTLRPMPVSTTVGAKVRTSERSVRTDERTNGRGRHPPNHPDA